MYALFGILGMIGTGICALLLLVALIRRKPKKKISIVMLVCFFTFVTAGILTPEMTPEERMAYEQRQAEKEEQKELERLEEENAKREAKEQKEAEQAAREETKRLEEEQREAKRIAEEEAKKEEERKKQELEQKQLEQEKAAAEKAEAERLAVTFEEIYLEYKENELRADDKYQYNRYRITAKINGINTDGLFNMTGGATLTMEKRVKDTLVFFYAEFEKEQEEALKSINVGDTITFEGECLSAGTWTDCEIIIG